MVKICSDFYQKFAPWAKNRETYTKFLAVKRHILITSASSIYHSVHFIQHYNYILFNYFSFECINCCFCAANHGQEYVLESMSQIWNNPCQGMMSKHVSTQTKHRLLFCVQNSRYKRPLSSQRKEGLGENVKPHCVALKRNTRYIT